MTCAHGEESLRDGSARAGAAARLARSIREGAVDRHPKQDPAPVDGTDRETA